MALLLLVKTLQIIANDVNTTPPEEVENISTDITNSSVETNPVKKPPVKIEAKPVSGKQGQKVKITAKFKTQDNKVLKNKKVTFKYDGKTYKTKTDKKGKASITIKLPKAKYFKTIKKLKGKILTVEKVYKTTRICNISIGGSDTQLKGSVNVKVTSKKKSSIKKYKYAKYRTNVIPFKEGERKYTIGSIVIGTFNYVEKDMQYILVIAGNKTAKTYLDITTKLKTLHHNGKYYWDRSWESCLDFNGTPGVVYCHDLNKVSKIKIRYESPHYERIK